MKYIKYLFYLSKTKWKGYKYFNYKNWLNMQYCIKNNLKYKGEYGEWHNIIFRT